MSADLTAIFGDIETAINALLKDKIGPDLKWFTAGDDVIMCPAANTTFAGASFRPITMNKDACVARYAITLAIRNVKSGEARRQAMYPLLGGVLVVLSNRELSITNDAGTTTVLDCSKLRLEKCEMVEATPERLVYQIDVSTSMTVVPVDDDADASDVIAVAMNYMLKAGDDTADASDTVSVGD